MNIVLKLAFCVSLLHMVATQAVGLASVASWAHQQTKMGQKIQVIKAYEKQVLEPTIKEVLDVLKDNTDAVSQSIKKNPKRFILDISQYIDDKTIDTYDEAREIIESNSLYNQLSLNEQARIIVRSISQKEDDLAINTAYIFLIQNKVLFYQSQSLKSPFTFVKNTVDLETSRVKMLHKETSKNETLLNLVARDICKNPANRDDIIIKLIVAEMYERKMLTTKD